MPSSFNPKFRSVALLFALVIATRAIAERADSSGAANAEIRAILETQAAAWNRGDIDGYMNGYARGPATRFISGDTLTRGWQTVRDRYKKKYDSREKMGRLSFEQIKVESLSADAAVVIGRWNLTRPGDKPRGRFTLLFRRTPMGWRIVHDHTSSALPRVADRRSWERKRPRIFSWMPSKPPLLKTTTTSSVFKSGTSRLTMCAESGS